MKFWKEFKISNSALLLLNKFQTVYLISVILFWSPRLVGSPKKTHLAVMWANWWNVYSKIWVKSNVLKYPDVCLEISFFDTSIRGASAPHSLHLPGQTKLFPPSQSKGLWTKERDDIRLQITKHYWAGISRFILPLLWKSDEKVPAWNHGK